MKSFDVLGHFGQYGGRFVPEALIEALDELEAVHNQTQKDPVFLAELAELHRTYTGRPSIITEAKRFSEHAGGARIFLKREDLNHTGSHKINNVLGQALLTKRMETNNCRNWCWPTWCCCSNSSSTDGFEVRCLYG